MNATTRAALADHSPTSKVVIEDADGKLVCKGWRALGLFEWTLLPSRRNLKEGAVPVVVFRVAKDLSPGGDDDEDEFPTLEAAVQRLVELGRLPA